MVSRWDDFCAWEPPDAELEMYFWVGRMGGTRSEPGLADAEAAAAE